MTPWSITEQLTRELLLKEYIENGRTARDIAKQFGCVVKLVTRRLREEQIPRRKEGKAKQWKCDLTESDLRRMYTEEQMKIIDIAHITGYSEHTVSRAMNTFGIQKRQRQGRPIRDMTGTVWGKLTVVGFSHVSHDHRAHWKCQCDCGKEIVSCGKELRRKGPRRTVTCGDCLSWFSKGGIIPAWFFNSLENGAKHRGLEVTITIDCLEELFLAQDGQCALSGVPLSFGITGKLTASVDRIDSRLGYVPGNVQFVHKWVNIAKGNLGQSEFVGLARAVAEHAGDADGNPAWHLTPKQWRDKAVAASGKDEGGD